MASNSSAGDLARENLEKKVDHFVVLMMENRSFDQMLGYLELDEFGGHDVDGLKREENEPPLFYEYAGKRYEPYPLERTTLTAAEAPCHDGWCVAEQLSNGNGQTSPITSQRPP